MWFSLTPLPSCRSQRFLELFLAKFHGSCSGGSKPELEPEPEPEPEPELRIADAVETLVEKPGEEESALIAATRSYCSYF